MIRIAVLLTIAVMAFSATAKAQDRDLAALTQAAQAGEASAQFEMAERLRRGDGVLQNYSRAVEWYRAAADQGESRAKNALGALMISGLGGQADPEAGFALLQEAAQTGELRHIFDLATAYEQGLGTAVDMAQAVALLQKAAAGGYVEAQVSLGVIYHLGTAGDIDIARALDLYRGPAEAGHPRALNNLGLIYARGDGVDQDYPRAAELFARAAEAGLSEALKNLGAMHENGFGVPLNEEEAKRLYRLASQGSADQGAVQIAFLYDPRLQAANPEEADTYRRASQDGDPVAQFMLAYLLVSGAQSGADFRDAARLFEGAAKKGLPVAMANLGLLNFEGKGVLQDYVEGYKWLTLAALNGPPGVAAIRDGLARRMTVEQINAANVLAEEYFSKMQ